MSLELPPLVRSSVLYVFFILSGGRLRGSFLSPLSKVGNSRLHSIWFCYLSFYGIVGLVMVMVMVMVNGIDQQINGCVTIKT